MLCRVEMPTNEQTTGRFYRYLLLHGPDGARRGSLVMMWITGLILAGFLWMMGAGVLGLLAAVGIVGAYSVYLLYIKPGMDFRKKAGIALQTEVYIFTEATITRSVRHEEGGLPDNSSTRYDGLLRAVETKQDFYLFTGPSQAYLVDKAYFTKGTPEELSEALQRMLGQKYKKK